MFRPGCLFKEDEIGKGFAARTTTYFKGGLEKAADFGALGPAKKGTAVLACQMHAAHPGGFAMRHLRKRR